MQIAKTGNDYLKDDWYGRAFATDSGYWSEPYIDDAGSGALMCTYSVPIHDRTGRKVGVFGADISLDWHCNTCNMQSKSQVPMSFFIHQNQSLTVRRPTSYNSYDGRG